jgi:hypothetical protein
MIKLTLQDPSYKIIKGIQYLSDERALISYHLSVHKDEHISANRDEYIEAHIVFKDFKGLQYIYALLKEFYKC